MTAPRYVIVLSVPGYGGSADEEVADLPAMQPGDSVRVTLRDDGGFDVVPLRKAHIDGLAVAWSLWADAPAEGDDRE